MTGRCFVAYYRVSTDTQARSGLGLEAQREAVRRFIAEQQGRLIAEFTDIESGRVTERPELAEALRICRVYRATLVIAKLDRLARNVAMITKLMDAGADFVAADMPLANQFTIHILAAVAEYELKLMSERSKAAAAVRKARGGKVGGAVRPDFRTYLVGGTAASNAARRRRALDRARDLSPLICELRDDGRSPHGIAVELTRRRIEPPGKGRKWYPSAVRASFVLVGERLPEPRASGHGPPGMI